MRVTKILLSVISLAVILINSGAAAEQGEQEIQFTGGFFFARGDADTGTAQLEIAYGYMLTPNWQTGIRLLASYELNDPIEDVWTSSTTAFVNYYLWGGDPSHRLKPFVGGFLGMGFSDVDNTGVAGPTFGLRYDFNESTSFIAQYRYEDYFRKLDAGDETDDFNSGNNILTLGLGFHW